MIINKDGEKVILKLNGQKQNVDHLYQAYEIIQKIQENKEFLGQYCQLCGQQINDNVKQMQL